ncbi:MAG: AsmA family protein [Gallionella sp.]
MNKLLKYLLLGIAAAVVVAALGIVYIALTFNPNDYKSRIIQAVKESKQRNLRLDGDIKLSFYPSIGANVSSVSLSEYRSDKEFAAIESLHVSLALLPLLHKEIIVDQINVNGVKISLIGDKDGRTNYDDLLGKGETAAQSQDKTVASPIKFDVASITVENTSFSYLDQRSGAQFAIKDLTLHTGRLANKLPCKIDISARLQSAPTKTDVMVQVATEVTFDLDAQRYQLRNLDARLNGKALDFTDLKTAVSGDIDADLGSQKISANKLSLNANLDAAFGKLDAIVTLPSIQLNGQSLNIPTLNLDANLKQPAQEFSIKASAPIAGDMKLQQFDLANLKVALNARGDKLPNKSVSSELQGNVQLDALKQSVRVSLAGGLLQSQIKARVAVNNFANPAINFDIALDQLDADLYLPKSAAAPVKTDAQSPEQPIDLSALRTLNLDGSLQIGTLKAFDVKFQKLHMDVKAKDGIVKVAPLATNLYNGTLAASITVNAVTAQSGFTANAKLDGIELGPLLGDALKMDFLSGKGNVALNLTTQGNLVTLLKKNLNGTMSVTLADGALKGINLAKSIRDFRSGGDKTQAASEMEKTDFSELKAGFKITDGVAHNDDLSLKSPFIRVAGNGDINIGQDNLNYLVKATVTGNIEGQGGKDDVAGLTVPVRLSGPFAQLKYKLEFVAMISDQAKQKAAAAADAAKQKAQQAIDAKKEQAKDKVQEQLKQGLKGLFK